MIRKIYFRINKKTLLVIIAMTVLIVGGFIWYGEQRANREVPKKAKFVGNFLIRSDNYR